MPMEKSLYLLMAQPRSASKGNLWLVHHTAAPGRIAAEVSDVKRLKLECHHPTHQEARLQNTRIYAVQSSIYYECGDIVPIHSQRLHEIEFLITASLRFSDISRAHHKPIEPLSISLTACNESPEACHTP